jgi:hypothetical protein
MAVADLGFSEEVDLKIGFNSWFLKVLTSKLNSDDLMMTKWDKNKEIDVYIHQNASNEKDFIQ